MRTSSATDRRVVRAVSSLARVGLRRVLALALAFLGLTARLAGGSGSVALPQGVEAVWDLALADRLATATRERVCLNGLWRWQPAAAGADAVPSDGWGYFKVPGCWPGISDYLQKDSQVVYPHPRWEAAPLGEVTTAWYQREFEVPAGWAGRRVAVTTDYLNSYAVVYVDQERTGELRFPGGEVDITRWCHPGSRQVLTMLVVAMPLEAVLVSYSDTASAREVKGRVERRGLCGDVFLLGTPAGERLLETRVSTSVRRGVITVRAACEGLRSDADYAICARLRDGGGVVHEFTGPRFGVGDLRDGWIQTQDPWLPARWWDLHTPTNQFDLEVSLLTIDGRLLDALPPVRFGFREFWIEGRDFFLNGSRVFLSALPLDNAQVSAAAATYAAARESLERLQSFGINFVYAHNYSCEPGAHLGFEEILRAADDVGMLVALTQPHFSHYDWSGAESDRTNGYARHAAYYARVAGSHPSVVMYATSHNATGYNEDMNPDLIDGRSDPRDNWAATNMRKAVRAESIIRSLDPERLVYHHASGNLGTMHPINFYPNFVPAQELSDWFEHWATTGVKPVFLCEYGAPFSWDWAMYRGWYQGRREFGSAVVPWEFCLAEWNAQFFGDRAFQISEMEKRNLRWETQQFHVGRRWHRWDYPHALGSRDFLERDPVFARYLTDNWRAFRTWGVSANSPWEHELLFRLREGMPRPRREPLPVEWRHLQRPGYSADYLGDRYERMDLAYERRDWEPTAAGKALLRQNGPLLAYIGGGPERFTSQDHLYLPGETFHKQLILLNNSRRPVRAKASWSVDAPLNLAGQAGVEIQTGDQARVPLAIALPAAVPPGMNTLRARVEFSTGEVQEDSFAFQVLSGHSPRLDPNARIAVFDPKGETMAWLRRRGVAFSQVEATEDLGGFDLLIIGKAALSVAGGLPGVGGVRDGLKVLVFEQPAAALERRLGFRVAEYGLRQVFPRIPDHPALARLAAESLRDWRGEATLVSSRLAYRLDPKFNGAPTVTWCGLTVPRAWRCGCQGNVASVLIEKPACGDFRPVVDGGFSLQYSPLLEYREGKGLVLFCQLDVTGRTAEEPAAAILADNLLEYMVSWKPVPPRRVVYAGDAVGRTHLSRAGFGVAPFGGGTLRSDELLVLGPGGGAELARNAEAASAFLGGGGRILALGATRVDAEATPALGLALQNTEHINAFFDPPLAGSPFAGVGPADVHCRAPRETPLLAEGSERLGDGVLGIGTNAAVVFCALAPWQFDDRSNAGLRRTYRRTAFLATRLMANLGAQAATPLAKYWSTPAAAGEPGRWLQSFYLDEPEEWDDPYRFFRW